MFSEDAIVGHTNEMKEKPMSNPDPLSTLNPALVGQAEKAHNAVLKKVLSGTSLDEVQWITVQLALAAGDGVDRGELLARVHDAAKFELDTLTAALGALIRAGLVQERPAGTERLAVTVAGQDLVSTLRQRVTELIGPAYGSIPPEQLAIAAQVLSALTAKLSEEHGS
jgi:hypothetical protein